MIITIARQCGCDGDTVGKMLSEIYNIPLYDKHNIIKIARSSGIYDSMPNFFAEKPINSFLYAIAEGEGETSVFDIPIKALRQTIGNNSCVLIGRCGNYALRNQKDVYRIFLSGNRQQRIRNIASTHNISEHDAEKIVDKTDNRRMSFQKYYTGEEWGSAENYDLCIDVSRIGIENTVKLIQNYIFFATIGNE
ncbi:MAG: AAA family ATPase [Acutalibacteraceae bacterium]